MSHISFPSDFSLLVRDARGRYSPASADQILAAARQVVDQKMQRGANFGSPVDVSDLATAAYEYEREVDAVVANDDELQAYMARLDAFTDDDDDDDDETDGSEVDEPVTEALTAEELVREVERYLRDQGSG